MNDAKSIGARIRQIRESTNMGQKEFAAMINASFRAIQNYEWGKSIPGGKVLENLAEQGFNVHWILTGSEEMRRPSPSEEFPLHTDLTRLETVIKMVDGYFAKRDFKIPSEYRNKIIIDIYRDIKNKKADLEKINLGDYFSHVLFQERT